VIVVDEFATLTAQLPELHELFADLAARGRSLGIHLILCTQRPAASVRDGVLANCSLRVSLRVTSDADSVSVLGTADAARLPRVPSGRGLIARADGGPELVHFAISGAEDVAAVTGELRGRETSPHRPWIDPLPALVLPGDVPAATGTALAFGLLDIPEEQRRSVATFDPAVHGNLVVLGGHRSGKSGVLAALAQGSVQTVMVPPSVEGAWDAVTAMLAGLREQTEPALVLLDDADELLGRLPPDHEVPFAERLSRLAREGPRAGVTLVLTAGAVRGRLQALSALCESTLLLRMSTKQDHVLAGGDGVGYLPNLPPGGGRWQGHRVQVTRVEAPPRPEPALAAELERSPESPLIVVSPRPSAIRERLERLGPVAVLGPQPRTADAVSVEAGSTVILGDPNAWQGAWAMLAALRNTARLVFHD
ncbi:MAG: cell division protein FtsK, partial [Salinibacterium sp.]|nr:cell division protein FtsK [Salinibacterium sp.]